MNFVVKIHEFSLKKHHDYSRSMLESRCITSNMGRWRHLVNANLFAKFLGLVRAPVLLHHGFAPWTIRPQPGRFAPWTIRSLDVSPPGRFAPAIDDSPPGRFTLWTIRL